MQTFTISPVFTSEEDFGLRTRGALGPLLSQSQFDGLDRFLILCQAAHMLIILRITFYPGRPDYISSEEILFRYVFFV